MTCQGQILSISQNTALFAILGTTYGGNGTTNFALPNLSGNVCVGAGNAVTGTQYFPGETGGATAVRLDQTNTPAHTHAFSGCSFRTEAETYTPQPNASYANAAGCKPYLPASTNPAPTLVAMSQQALSVAGVTNQQAHNNMMPTLGTNYCICIQGLFPPRP
jgi:microcystin-dependent protein